MSKTLKGGNPGGRIKQSNVRKMARGGMQRLPRAPQHARAGVNPYGPQCTYSELEFVFMGAGSCGTGSPSQQQCDSLCINECGGAECIADDDGALCQTGQQDWSDPFNPVQYYDCTCMCVPG